MEAQLTVRVPKKIVKGLDRKAKKSGLKKSYLVRMALQQFLERPFVNPQEEPEELSVYERVKHIVGKGDIGIKNIKKEGPKQLKERMGRRAFRLT